MRPSPHLTLPRFCPQLLWRPWPWRAERGRLLAMSRRFRRNADGPVVSWILRVCNQDRALALDARELALPGDLTSDTVFSYRCEGLLAGRQRWDTFALCEASGLPFWPWSPGAPGGHALHAGPAAIAGQPAGQGRDGAAGRDGDQTIASIGLLTPGPSPRAGAGWTGSCATACPGSPGPPAQQGPPGLHVREA